jgi:alkanesulfonate monooxygenase SsuD/methylene tetrahydromethanopterin reductase-like flavin-dependent oxidoreductase (luciferase family)
MKELWANKEAEFHGHHVDFDATYCWPKPVQKPHPKIYIGGFTAATVSRARRHHAGWMPMAVPVADMVPAQLGLLDGATDIPVSVIVPESVEPAVLDAYRQHGAERALILLSTKPESERSNCSTALRHSPKHTAEPGRSAGGWADPRQDSECVTAAMH